MAASWPEEISRIMPQRFVGEAIKPVAGTSDTARMAIGEPGLPREFVWRGRTVAVTAVLRVWRETGRCRHGSPEMYVRRHWYQVATVSDGTMKIYFDRQPRGGRKKPRWWLFSIREDSEGR
jgi:phosphoribosylglycinamide formyltransferase-1